MVVQRGDIWWADLGEPTGSAPGYRRPVIVIQNDAFNRSGIGTTIVASLTPNLRLIDAPGNVLIHARESGLRRDSVVNVSQLVSISTAELSDRVGRVDSTVMSKIDRGLRLVLGL